MKKYTPEALWAIREFFEWVTNVYAVDFDYLEKNAVLDGVSYEDLEYIAHDMMIGDGILVASTYSSYEFLAYRYLRPYIRALGIAEGAGLARCLGEGSYDSQCCFNDLLNETTEKLIAGLYDTWDYFASNEEDELCDNDDGTED